MEEKRTWNRQENMFINTARPVDCVSDIVCRDLTLILPFG